MVVPVSRLGQHHVDQIMSLTNRPRFGERERSNLGADTALPVDRVTTLCALVRAGHRSLGRASVYFKEEGCSGAINQRSRRSLSRLGFRQRTSLAATRP
jgi:hypothetical protein